MPFSGSAGVKKWAASVEALEISWTGCNNLCAFGSARRTTDKFSFFVSMKLRHTHHCPIRMFGGPLPCCAHDAMVRLVRIASHLGNRYEAGAEESARPKMASTTTPLLMRSGTPQSRTPFAVRHPFYLTSASEDTWGLSRSVCVHLLESCRCCVAVFDGAVLQEQVSTKSTKD